MSVCYFCLRTLKLNTLAYERIFQKIEYVRYVAYPRALIGTASWHAYILYLMVVYYHVL